MTRYKHILLAADLIERDDELVVQKAKDLAQTHHAKLSMIHVIEHPYHYGSPDGMAMVAEWEEEMERNANEKLELLAEKAEIPFDQCFLPTGQPQQLILETAKKIDADLIVVGSHGRHGISLLFMGSTANAIMHGANCDVLAVRVPDEKK